MPEPSVEELALCKQVVQLIDEALWRKGRNYHSQLISVEVAMAKILTLVDPTRKLRRELETITKRKDG